MLEVKAVEGTRVRAHPRAGGELSDCKGLNKQGGGLSAPALTDKDLEDIRSRPSSASTISRSPSRATRPISRGLGAAREGAARMVAKIERHEAIENLEPSSVHVAVMVARGDLGVEMGYAELTGLQKTIIAQARAKVAS